MSAPRRPPTPAASERGRTAWRLGHDAEDHVAGLLVADGVELLARNWVGGGGELDLVVRRGGKLRFCEVKARTTEDLDPLESIGPGKRAKLVSAARAWIEAHGDDMDEVAFLVALVDCTSAPWRVTWLDDAFDAG